MYSGLSQVFKQRQNLLAMLQNVVISPTHRCINPDPAHTDEGKQRGIRIISLL